jgi:tetraacyldisaccharide 4'-kinase
VFHRLKILLFPFAILYGLVMRLRNHLYNIGYRKEISFDVMTIGVGNLAMGGTGKTPLSEYLIKRFKDQFHIAVLSRGYGRKTFGIKIATKEDTIHSIGDEPLQVFKKFGEEIVIAVGENRLLAIPQILQERPEINMIILDDVYQHRKVKPTVNLLLTNYASPFYFDFIFPVGWLREPRQSARRADAIVVSKCDDDMKAEERERVRNSIRKYSQAPIFFTGLKYGRPIPFGSSKEFKKIVVVVSAIANNYLFGNYCASAFEVVHHTRFEDHHYFSDADLQPIIQLAIEKNASIVTTEKDMVKLMERKNQVSNAPWFYVPIESYFLDGEEDFNKLILEKAQAIPFSKS